MPLDRASRPGQRHARFDRLVILIQSFRKALQGLQRTGRRALQPGVKRFRLPLADQGRKVLRQVDRLGDIGLLRAQLGELLCLSLGALRLASEDKPCRPAPAAGDSHRCAEVSGGGDGLHSFPQLGSNDNASIFCHGKETQLTR